MIRYQTHHVALTRRIRRYKHKSCLQTLRRDPDLNSGDEAHVMMQCSRCKHPKTRHVDRIPLYEKATRRFVKQVKSCRMCPSIVDQHGQCSGSLPGENRYCRSPDTRNVKDSALRNSRSTRISSETSIFEGSLIFV